MNATAETLLASLGHARAMSQPYPYWLLDAALPDAVAEGIARLPIDPPHPGHHDGTRECNNQTRTFINAELCARSSVCRELAGALKDRRTVDAFERLCGTDLSRGDLRIEYTQDCDGFWLEPHTDIGVKLFTMLVYLSDEPDLADSGTDIYDGDHKHVGRAPFGRNRGLIFIPGPDTWHGFEKRPIRGVRRSIIVNYVSPEWRAREQLA